MSRTHGCLFFIIYQTDRRAFIRYIIGAHNATVADIVTVRNVRTPVTNCSIILYLFFIKKVTLAR